MVQPGKTFTRPVNLKVDKLDFEISSGGINSYTIMLNVSAVVLTVKVEGLIEPPLAQMTSTKACYKLGLRVLRFLKNVYLFFICEFDL